MNIDVMKEEIYKLVDVFAKWAVSPQFYAQIIAVLGAIFLAWFIAKIIKNKLSSYSESSHSTGFNQLAHRLTEMKDLFPSLFAILFLSIAIQISQSQVGQSWLVIITQGLAVVLLLRTAIRRFIHDGFIRTLFLWVGIPIATLHVFGWLPDVIAFLDSMALEVGNIRLSAYAIARIAIFGSILFWLGRLSNKAGKDAIRKQETLDIRSREVFSKLFEIALFMVIFFVFLQIIGINLTTLAVFGGALGVGLGFGLQQIASNFISGIIILLDGSITVGDYIELEDGRSGNLIALNMRSSTIETFEGKEIVVPNEQFITTAFTNWTRKDPYQRYAVEFSVSYHSDIPAIPKLILDAVKKHPQILESPEAPDCEIIGFGDSGVNFHVEYWMEGIDDGKNRVDSDLMLIIWNTLKENNISMPFPQREIRILNEDD